MNPNHLLDLFEATEDRFVAEAISSRRGEGAAVPGKRILLLAAAVAAALLLLGCAAVYLWMNDLPLVPHFSTYYDEESKNIVTVEREEQVTLFSGTTNKAMTRAGAEWYVYLQNHVIHPDELYDQGHPEVPDNLEQAYNCYNPERLEQLREIMDRYDLLPLGDSVIFQRYQSAAGLELLGIERLFHADMVAAYTTPGGYLYAPKNFKMEYSLTLPVGESGELSEFSVAETYCQNGYMPASVFGIWKTQILEQWTYTNAHGVQLLMALAPGNRGVIVAEQAEGCLAVYLGERRAAEEHRILDRQCMELVADVVDFTVTPRAVDPEAARTVLDAAEAAWKRETGQISDSYEDHLKRTWTPDTLLAQKPAYALADITGDGKPELHFSTGIFLTEAADGSVVLQSMTSPDYVGDNLVWMWVNKGNVCDEYSIYRMTDTFAYGQRLTELIYYEGKWYQDVYVGVEELANYPTISRSRVEALLSSYHFVPVQYDWKSLQDYPMSNGQSLLEYLQTQPY